MYLFIFFSYKKGVKCGCAEMVRSGTTCFNDMYYLPQETAELVNRIGMRAVIGLMGRDKKGTQDEVCIRDFKSSIGRSHSETEYTSISSHSLWYWSPFPLFV